ncbi:integral membrane protein MviN [Streptomyces sp. NBRC 110611]|uniref:FtsX-like permease family protein n=1 Tax=Streptomyces sp. NBRC 110611 TaxID=1621259 RepID=UPI000857E3A3|nr:FtsX-like permease family protein [Streptomyces sp. NBRC 110611]GAU65200.1 integral membrane protein MviN [Streptomyces sp. NBRC 110611]
MNPLRSPADAGSDGAGGIGGGIGEQRTHPAPAYGSPPAAPRTGPAAWARDLAMGMRFAAGGGREGWIRTALTAVGVALGVAVLLIGASVPTLMDARHGREQARENLGQKHEPRPGDTTLRYASADTAYHGAPIRGRVVRPDGAHPPLPPGVAHLPGPGRMLVSPALKELLDSPQGALLRDRLDYTVAGTIGDAGLLGPRELTYFAQNASLTSGYHISRFGHRDWEPDRLGTPVVLLVTMTCVALMMPVMVFIGTSVRFGNERRERRLAALRLVGADVRTTRRIASGEALFGSLLGLLGGGALFLGIRQLAPLVTLWDINVFSADVTPGPVAAALIGLLVPAAAVLVTLFAQRGVTVEPLGIVRARPAVRRRLWWRLVLPATGILLLVPLAWEQPWSDTPLNTIRLAAGSMLLLFGVTALLPWLVDAVVGRLRGGPVPWQLAVRRLQLSSASATRAVGGITVAVAGAIAIHMLMTGMQAGYAQSYAESGKLPQLTLWGSTRDWPQAQRALADLRTTPGVTSARGTIESWAGRMPAPGRDPAASPHTSLAVGSCAELRRLADLPSCRDGDVFLSTNIPARDPALAPGFTLDLNAPEYDEKPVAPRPWKIPGTARDARLHHPGYGPGLDGYDLLLTPSAVNLARLSDPTAQLRVDFDRNTPDAVEYIRNTAARFAPPMREFSVVDNPHDAQLGGVRNALFIGSVITLLLIGAGLIITTVEQLYERRRLLSVLDAYGTRRATLGWSVLWQTAVPVALGLALALACGLALGSLLLSMIESAVIVDWPVVAAMTAIGGGVILFVTALSLPPLWRMMRPEGLRTE